VPRLQSVLASSGDRLGRRDRRVVADFFWITGLLLTFLVSYPREVNASCWASNPTGDRKCQFFQRPNSLKLWLCEDNDGDCQALGYEPLGALSRDAKPQQSTKQAEDTATHSVKALTSESLSPKRAPSAPATTQNSSATLGGPTPAPIAAKRSSRGETDSTAAQANLEETAGSSSAVIVVIVILVTGVLGFALGCLLASINL
jgi:hypothetical protein